MKKISLLLCAILALLSCENGATDQGLSCVTDDVVLSVALEGDDTRMHLNTALKTVWDSGDELSLFYGSVKNQRWCYCGETGSRVGVIAPSEDVDASALSGDILMLYPYRSSGYTYLSSKNTFSLTLPGEQSYRASSYGEGSNMMLGVSTDREFVLRNLMGWLRISLTGNGERVVSVALTGNSEEPLAGRASIDVATLAMTSSSSRGVVKTITIDCGAGVELTSAPTDFYFAIIPQTFAEGFTITVTTDDGCVMTQTTLREVVVERNGITPMQSLAFSGVAPEPPVVELPEDPSPTKTNFKHRILLIDHTGVWCSNCPRVMSGLEALAKTEYADYYNEVTNHPYENSYDIYDYAYSAAAVDISRFYSPSGYPNVRFNYFGGTGSIKEPVTFVSENSAMINSLVNRSGVDVGISVATKVNDTSVDVAVGLKVGTAADYYVAVWLLESNISNPYQQGATEESHRVSHNALRNIAGDYDVEDIYGRALGRVAAKEVNISYYNIPLLSDSWKVENMDILVLVSTPDSQGYFKDVVNTMRCKVGESVAYDYR